jgi:RecA-family ATPase
MTAEWPLFADAVKVVADATGEPASNGHMTRRTSWTAAELMAATFPPARFAVPTLIPDGLAFLAGAPKLGKSWLMLGLGIAVASGGHALGTIEVERGEVLYLSLEDSPRRLQERLSMVLGDDQPPAGLHFETEWPRMGSGGAERIEEWIGEHLDARLVIIDVFTRIRAPELKRADLYRADYEAAIELQSIATRSGVAIVCVYHTRKTEDSDFVAMMSGTFGLAAGADTILIARRGRGEADATLYATGRDITEQELALRFAPEARTWAILGDAAIYSLGETRRELYEAIKDHETLTPKQAASVTSVSYELAKKTLQRMAKDGELKADRGRYSLQTSVPGVPLSPDEDEHRDKGTRGTLSRRDLARSRELGGPTEGRQG